MGNNNQSRQVPIWLRDREERLRQDREAMKNGGLLNLEVFVNLTDEDIKAYDKGVAADRALVQNFRLLVKYLRVLWQFDPTPTPESKALTFTKSQWQAALRRLRIATIKTTKACLVFLVLVRKPKRADTSALVGCCAIRNLL